MGKVRQPTAAPATRADRKPLPGARPTASDPRFLQLVPYITGPLRKGDRVGTWVYDEITAVNGATTGYTHPLGRVPNGFLVLNVNANFNFWITDADKAAFTSTTAQWHGSGAGTVRGFWL